MGRELQWQLLSVYCLSLETYNFANAKCINPTCHVTALSLDQMGLKDLVKTLLIHLNNMTRNVIFRKMNILNSAIWNQEHLVY